ncbi:Endonuclease, Uma2 family (restriction endonuclease fold) [Abditibacterium utsteinense]|uniref:Endonuclease, Uma2 family (Restriction endonuclease fold) n=1 Tax=Abditibacterium utsteinense TaxID=1960156 RepID=A0A2S8SNR2_9BACT|nr:Uma2 family endonuclease [Abditibacterium utsteinense]PQV62433.1 Endonuclease, Uma2 family (restriction endonuclease fold) [Abditibacterium utsteinense]
MSAQRKHQTFYSLDEYLAFENSANARHEYYQGEIYAMAGTTPRHNDIAVNIVSALHSQLRGRPCKARGMDQRLRVDAADLTTYPDVLVVCPPFSMSSRDSIAATDATVIIEVLSPSTARYDQTAKFDFYSNLDSFRHYLLVESNQIGVEHRFKTENGEWTTQTFSALNDEIALQSIECRLTLREIYEEIEF